MTKWDVEGRDIAAYETKDEAIEAAIEKAGIEVKPGCENVTITEYELKTMDVDFLYKKLVENFRESLKDYYGEPNTNVPEEAKWMTPLKAYITDAIVGFEVKQHDSVSSEEIDVYKWSQNKGKKVIGTSA